ncbi:MAG: hypothetical protein COC08_07185, partial [Maribacter sp.]
KTGLFENTYLVISILIVPILEELLFRRLIFRKLLKQYNVITSIILTSFLFAINHQSLGNFFAYFFIGFVYTYFYYLTKNLWLIVLLHILYNILASITIIKIYPIDNSIYFIGLFTYLICGLVVFLTLKNIKKLIMVN